MYSSETSGYKARSDGPEMGEGHRFCPLRCSQLGKEQTFLGMLEDLAGKRKKKKKQILQKSWGSRG